MNDCDTTNEALTVEQTVRQVAGLFTRSTTAMIDARLLAMQALGLDEAGLIIAGPRQLSTNERTSLNALVARRAAGEPIAYILGRKEFFGQSFELRPGVLTPRPDSETLIQAAIEARAFDTPLRILDLGIGSGCLLISLLMQFPSAIGVGVDRNPTAIETARVNALRLGVADRLSLFRGDWFSSLVAEFDLIIANPPYISKDDRNSLARDVRDYEDPLALFAGADGLDAYRDILPAAPPHLAASGLMILELGAGQAPSVMEMAKNAFPAARCWIKKDLAGVSRALIIDRRHR